MSVFYNDEATSMAIQADGKILVAGCVDSGVGLAFALARYNIDGTVDTSFDGDGVVTTYFSGLNATATSMSTQADGKIVVAGYVDNGVDSVIALARYNSNGTLDASFSGDGVVTTDFSGLNATATSMSIQVDGKIVVAGYAYNGSYYFALARYNTDGTLDTSFSGDGRLTTDFGGTGSNELATSMTIQTDGKIVVAGYLYDGSDYDFALARYDNNGTLDTSFSSDGKLSTDFGGLDEYAFAVGIQDDGKIVVAGKAYNGSDYDFSLARYNSNGTLDTSFSGDGRLTTDISGNGSDERVNSMSIQGDGKIVVTGFTFNDVYWDFALARYNSDGSLDTSFSNDGKLTTDFGGSQDTPTSMSIQSDGKIVVAGYSYDGTYEDFALARYWG